MGFKVSELLSKQELLALLDLEADLFSQEAENYANEVRFGWQYK